MEKSKSELLLESILKKLELIALIEFDDFNDDLNAYESDMIYVEITKLVMQLYSASIVDNFYYLDCPIEVYINTYEARFKKVRKW